MSHSNPMHHAPGRVSSRPVEPRRGAIWPFPRTPLPLDTLAPEARPLKPAKPDPASMPDAPY